MMNSERVFFAVTATLIGFLVSLLTMPIFVALDINPMWWFLFDFAVLMPSAFTLGWCNAEAIDAWLSRSS